MTLDQLNALPDTDFIAALGSIYEHSPWVAEAVLAARPFASVDTLHQQMAAAVAAAPRERRLALIRAHPQLAGKAAIRGELTAASASEQAGAGLDACSPEEFAELTRLNTDYDSRVGFPFILAVRGHTRASIIANLRERQSRPAEVEEAEALRQIDRIAGFRLNDLFRP